MYGTDKPKAKALATASTLQKVVCPAPPADPQEILSNGWRKVGEQKRVTNRLANGHPDRGVGVSSREPSFKGSAAVNRQNGREVLDKMFGHMRPHHIAMPTAVNRAEEQELENGLGSQAARAAFYRPAISPALNDLPPGLQQQLSEGPGSCGGSLELGVELDAAAAAAGGDVDDDVQISPSSPGTPSGGGGRGSQPRRNEAQLRQDSTARRTGSGASTPAAMSNGRMASPRTVAAAERRGALPAVGRSYPSDGGAVTGRRRASISGGDTVLPAIGPSAAGGHGGAAACGGKDPMGRTRRTSLTLGYQDAHGSAATVLLSNMLRKPRRMSLTGSGGGGGGSPIGGGLGASCARAGLRGGGPPPLDVPVSPNPALARIAQATGGSHSAPLLKMGLGSSFRHNSGGGSAAAAAAAAGATAAAAAEVAPSSMLATLGLLVQVAAEASVGIGGIGGGGGGGGSGGLGGGGGSGGVGGGGSSGGISVSGLSGGGGSGLSGGGGSGLSGGGGSGLSGGGGSGLSGGGGSGGSGLSGGGGSGGAPNPMNPALPLSGLENLAGTGLGDAISQLRNIRMAGQPGGGGGGGGGTAAGGTAKKAEPGLAGLTPLQLLPVPLPPLDNWQTGGKQVPDLDPCRGIRLVDAANYVLPRPTAEASLQVRMAQNQAAMRHLVKAEGPPMSDVEMEAVKLLGRLERSGARHRNFDAMDSMGPGGHAQGEEEAG